MPTDHSTTHPIKLRYKESQVIYTLEHVGLESWFLFLYKLKTPVHIFLYMHVYDVGFFNYCRNKKENFKANGWFSGVIMTRRGIVARDTKMEKFLKLAQSWAFVWGFILLAALVCCCISTKHNPENDDDSGCAACDGGHAGF